MTIKFFLFLALATALAMLVVLLLAPILWRGVKSRNVDGGSVNAAVLRDQLTELERDLASGILSVADHQQAKQELQRRALEEAKPDADAQATGQGSKLAAIAFAVLLPLAAFGAYLALGNPAALSTRPDRSEQVTQADVEAMVASLEDKLKRNPDNAQGWAMLARSYRTFGRHEDAARAFSRARPVIEADPQLLVEFAETLAITNKGNFEGEAASLLELALKHDPNHQLALALAGSAAFERADYAGAITYWRRLSAQLPPESEGGRAIEDALKRARSAKDRPVKPREPADSPQ